MHHRPLADTPVQSAHPRMTWKRIIRIEPNLGRLYKEAKAIRDDKTQPSFCANRIWYEEFKPRLLWLVGWECRKKELRSMEAYDIAYDKIYKALPYCRECICL